MSMQSKGRALIGLIFAALSFLIVDVGTTTPVLAAACAPTVTRVGTDEVVTFTSVGTCQWVVPAGITAARSLIVGGGGGGGFDIGGGGGAGGFREVANVVLRPGETVTITVGNGGSGDLLSGSPCVGSNGEPSSLTPASGALISIGGGGGGGQSGGGACATDGLSGASGGGGGVGLSWPRIGGLGTYLTDGDSTTFGTNGGNTPLTGGYYAGGGGGGAGTAGSPGSSDGNGSIGGAGGNGRSSDITGAAVPYAGGGAGGFFQSGTRGLGGTGGGGNGGTSNTSPTVGTDGLGGGGGGGGVANGIHGQGKNGGSGVVIVRYDLTPTTTTTTSTTTTSTTTTSTTIATTTSTTVRSPVTTAAPVLEIVVNAPATTILVSQAAVATVPVVVNQTPVTTTPVARIRTSSTTIVTPTTTTVPRTEQKVDPKPPQVPAVVAGEAGVNIGNKTEPANVERVNNQLVITAGAIKATVGGLDSSGAAVVLDKDGNVRLQTGDRVRIKLAGFKPGSIVEAWLFSTPTLLGKTKVTADGTVTGDFFIPRNISDGSHRIALVTRTNNGKPAVLTVGVLVGEWKKEGSITVWLIIVPIALAVMGAMVLPATRRRRRVLAN